MSHINIIKFIKNNHKIIDLYGTLKDSSWKVTILIALSIMLVYLYYIDIFYKRYPITLHCNTLYSHFTEQLLILNKIPYYKIYQPYINNIAYYTASKKKTVFINPLVKDWLNETMNIIPFSYEELMLMSDHLNISFDLVKNAQDQVLLLLPDINAYHIIRGNYLEDDVYDKHHYSIKNVTKIGNLYKVTMDKNYFYTSCILTDDVQLHIGDIINGCYYSNTEQEFYTENKYVVNHQYELESLNKKLKEDMIILPFYNLEVPRKQIKIHPFHLPKSRDPILSLLILTQLLI